MTSPTRCTSHAVKGAKVVFIGDDIPPSTKADVLLDLYNGSERFIRSNMYVGALVHLITFKSMSGSRDLYADFVPAKKDRTYHTWWSIRATAPPPATGDDVGQHSGGSGMSSHTMLEKRVIFDESRLLFGTGDKSVVLGGIRDSRLPVYVWGFDECDTIVMEKRSPGQRIVYATYSGGTRVAAGLFYITDCFRGRD